jgi:mono/diheme cytochrome c family protein
VPRALIIALVVASAATGACRSSVADRHAREIAELRREGRELFFGRAGCHTCHKIGAEGKMIIGPNLGVGDGMTAPVALRARERRPDLLPIEYVVESIVDPDAVVVSGYARGVMKRYEEPPIALTDDEIVALAAFVAGEGEGVRAVDLRALGAARARIATVRAARTTPTTPAPTAP